MRFLAALLVSTVLLPIALQAQTRYFPPGMYDQFVSEWYTKQLKALEEPSLWELSKTSGTQAYRFLWLRTFHHPVAIRLEINSDGTSRVTSKMASGAGGYDPGKLIQNDVATLTKERTDWFLEIIENNSFWKLPARDETRMGCDGAQWIVEGVRDGSYHLVDRWSPRDGQVHAIGMAMIKELVKLQVAAKEIY